MGVSAFAVVPVFLRVLRRGGKGRASALADPVVSQAAADRRRVKLP
ncbi:hypothetical protein AIOL_000568 [Candidatus Rhodobacter oscarellae]|uniref:Uncharacterized protein n=1 Tax=Candidatus Rhodobacter oscarellae TaxID=1675527 RepID=A0A0J9H3Z3_9RHOB|nr:hypothetical protein AIOL_000568 [Candidatus Rhodobacter lobularis]